MKRLHRLYLMLVMAWLLPAGLTCRPEPAAEPAAHPVREDSPPPQAIAEDAADAIELVFNLELNRQAYRRSDFGEPPQLAIWLENADGIIRTVWVSRSTGKGLWLGKVECPVSLPYWVSRYNRQTGTQGPPTFKQPVVDAVTGATPTTTLTRRVRVPAGSQWDYFLEVNVSGDYNADFERNRADGLPDPQENGQPSLIYRGAITAAAGFVSQPELIGRSDQWRPTDAINPDTSGITTAKELLGILTVTAEKPD